MVCNSLRDDMACLESLTESEADDLVLYKWAWSELKGGDLSKAPFSLIWMGFERATMFENGAEC